MADENKKQQLRRRFISLEDKIQILNRLKNGEKVASITRSLHFNEATIRTIRKNENKIRKSAAEASSISAKRVARVQDIDMIRMENALMVWFEDCRRKKIPLNGNFIRQKALKIYKHLKEVGQPSEKQQNQSFFASKGWLEKLKKRYSLHSIKLQEKQASADVKGACKLTEEICETPLTQIVEEENFTPLLADAEYTHIINTTSTLDSTSRLDGAEPANIQHVKEVFQEQNVIKEKSIECINQDTTSNMSIDNLVSINDDLFTNLDLNDIQKTIDLGKQLELHVIEKDPSIVRRGKFRRELQRCLLPYQELLAELQSSNNTSVPKLI